MNQIKMLLNPVWRHNLLKKALDPTDIRILTEIQEDASLTNVALAERVGCHPRHVLPASGAREAGVIARRVTFLTLPTGAEPERFHPGDA